MLLINFDISFLALPCSLLSLDSMDVSGEVHCHPSLVTLAATPPIGRAKASSILISAQDLNLVPKNSPLSLIY